MTAVAGDRTNKTIAIACVALMIFTVTYVMISAEDDSDADTIHLGVNYYYKVTGETKYTDDDFEGYKYIYVYGDAIIDKAFANCTTIRTLYLADSVKSIGNSAFEGCTALDSIYAPKVETIGSCAFKNSSLRAATFGEPLTTIDGNAFENTSKLDYMPLWPTTVTKIENGTFMNSGLKFIDLRKVESLGPTAFSGCSLSLQMVKTGQTVLVPGICRMYCDDDSLIGRSNCQIYDVTFSGSRITFTMHSQGYLSIVPVNGGEDKTTYKYNAPWYYAYLNIADGTDYVLSASLGEICLPEGLGVDTFIRPEKLPYTLPNAVAGDLTFNGWKAEGTSGYVTEVTKDLMQSWNGRVVLTAEFGSANLFMDHSAISDRTDVSSLPTRAGFTYGSCYEDLAAVEGVKGYKHVGWVVDGVTYAVDAEITTYRSHTAYSVWEPTIAFAVVYVQADGTAIGEATVPYNMTIEPDMSMDVDEEAGKRFIGWSLDGSTVLETVRVGSDTVLKPVFEDRATFTVTVKDRGTVLSSATVYDGRAYAFQQEDPFSDTQIFLRWTGGMASGTEIVVTSDVVIESEWRDRAKYTVTYKDGRTVLKTAIALEGIPFEISIDDPVCKGKMFVRWFSEDDSMHVGGDRLDVSADTTLYAEWVELQKYTVTVIDRDAVVESLELYAGETYMFSHAAPSAEGMVFVGWMCAGSEVADGQEFVMERSISIASEWRLPYTFSLIFSDGTGTDRTFTVTEGGTMTISFANPVSIDGIFDGWKGSDGIVHEYGDVIAPENSMTFSALWREREEYRVSFFDGDAEVGTAVAKEGLEFTIGQSVAPKTGYRFLGWAFDGRSLNIGDSLEIYGDAAMTASWEALEVCKVRYMDGETVLGEISGYEGDTVTIGHEHPMKDDYVFLTWEIDGSAVSEGQRIVLDSDINVEAVWKALDEFTVKFIDGETPLKFCTCKEGEMFTITIDDPVSETRDFKKWTDGENSYVNGDSLTPSEDIELFAVWTDKAVHKVVFMDGEGIFAERIGYHGSRFTVDVEDPVREGKSFAGWEFEDAVYSNGSGLVLTGDAVLEAVWTDRAVYTLTYYSEGEIAGSAEVTDGCDVLLDKKLKRDGYSFKGWSLTDGGKVSKINGDVIRPTGNIALYAVWEKNSQPSTDPEEDKDGCDSGTDNGSSYGFDHSMLAVGAGVAALMVSLLAIVLRRS